MGGSTTTTEGRVEFCNSNDWGTVCDDSWDNNDASVVCRQLGFTPQGAMGVHRAFFGQGTGSILLDEVRCTGTESRLADCPANPIGSHDCGHHEDAGVRCTAPTGVLQTSPRRCLVATIYYVCTTGHTFIFGYLLLRIQIFCEM